MADTDLECLALWDFEMGGVAGLLELDFEFALEINTDWLFSSPIKVLTE